MRVASELAHQLFGSSTSVAGGDLKLARYAPGMSESDVLAAAKTKRSEGGACPVTGETMGGACPVTGETNQFILNTLTSICMNLQRCPRLMSTLNVRNTYGISLPT